jgi:hypothetical protein
MNCWWQEPIMHQPAPIKFIGPISQENKFNMQEHYIGLEDTMFSELYDLYRIKGRHFKAWKRDPLVLISFYFICNVQLY